MIDGYRTLHDPHSHFLSWCSHNWKSRKTWAWGAGQEEKEVHGMELRCPLLLRVRAETSGLFFYGLDLTTD